PAAGPGVFGSSFEPQPARTNASASDQVFLEKSIRHLPRGETRETNLQPAAAPLRPRPPDTYPSGNHAPAFRGCRPARSSVARGRKSRGRGALRKPPRGEGVPAAQRAGG